MIDTKNAQNLLILLRARYKHSSHEDIRKYILRCDTSMLNVDFLDQLIKSIPEPKVKQLLILKSDGVQLIDVEEFLVSLCGIKRLVPRLHCLKLKIDLDAIAQNLDPYIMTATAACEEVMTSKKFNRILGLILSIGNVMNAGSNIGRAVAFELPILTKLNDPKGTKNCKTLLHFIVDTIERKCPECLSFGDELLNVNEAAHVSAERIYESVQEMSGSLQYIQGEVEKVVSDPLCDEDDAFVEVMASFASKWHAELEKLTKKMKHMQNSYIQVSDFFAFDIKKYRMEECFNDIATFKNLFSLAYKELVESRKAKQIAMQKEERLSMIRYEPEQQIIAIGKFKEFSVIRIRIL